MTKWIFIDLSVLFCAMVLTGIIIPQILHVAFRKQLFDVPDPRKIHKLEVPRLGGIAFFPSIMLVVYLLYGFGTLYGDAEVHRLLDNNILVFSFITSGSILLYLTGMADDLVGVRYKAKFVMQVLSAVFIIFGGLQVESLHGLLGLHELPTVMSVTLTLLLIVFITNAINLIDGIDGLASGLSAMASAFYAYVFYRANLFVFSAFAIATFGVLMQFFYYNVFGNAEKRRKIFMGDTGALTIGLFLSVMGLRVCQLEDIVNGSNPGVTAFAPLLIPCLDVVRVYFHRLKARRNPFLPDKTHIHHKLLAMGMKQRYAMMTIVSISLLLTLSNYWLSRYVSITVLFTIDIVVWILANIMLTRSIRARERRLGKVLYE